jgi:hypothetical protein
LPRNEGQGVANTIEPLPLDEAFDREYEIEWLRDMPSSTKWPRYGDGAGPILRVTPDGGEPFIMVVPAEKDTMRLSTLPNPRQFFVFSPGADSLIIDIDRPQNEGDVKVHGLAQLIPLKEEGVMLLSSCCDLIALDAAGVRWETHNELFCCDEPMIEVDGANVIVDGDNHRGRKRTVIEARTGKIVEDR